MHTLEIDDATYESLMKYAEQAGKSPAQLLQEFIAQVQQKPRPLSLAKDKGVPLPDTMYEPLPNDFLEFLQNIDTKNPPDLTDLIGKVPPCFNNTQEVDRFIRAERDAWED